MPDTTFIYGLLEPDTGKLRYIGKANDPHKRLRQHLRRKGKTHRAYWIESLTARGLVPELQLLLEVAKPEWEFWERDMIQTFREAGCKLVNGTAGGDGTEGHQHSARAKEKISKARIGKPAYNRGHSHSAQTKEKISKALIGKPAYNRGCPQSNETRAKLSAAALGKPKSEAHKAAIKKSWILRRLKGKI